MRRHLPALSLLLLILIIPSLASASPRNSNSRALIIANEFDSKAADILESYLANYGFSVERSTRMIDGYDFYFILGGPLAKDVGWTSRRYLPTTEFRALIDVQGYWAFSEAFKGRSEVLMIAGHTRKETLKAVETLTEKGIIGFIVDRNLKISPPLSKGELRNTTTLSFKWRFPPEVGKEYNVSLEVPKPLIDFFRVKPRMRVAEFNESRKNLIFTWYLMVRSPHDDPYISELAEKLESLAEGMDEYRKLWFIASFVQSMKYSLANEFSPTGDYPSYPLETLYRGSGDCEDLSILLISLYEQMGYKSALLIMPTHAAVAVSMPPRLVKWPRAKYDLISYEGTPVVLIDLQDLEDKLSKGKTALEFNIGGINYFYVETTNYFMPGEAPDLSWLAYQIGWPYRDFPIFFVSMHNVSVPLIANYTITSRRIGKGYGITIIAKLANTGERETVPLKLEAQLYPLSGVEVGGNDPHLINLGEAGERLFTSSTASSLEVGSLEPGEVRTVVMNFYTPISKMGAGITLKYGSSALDFIRIKPFNPKG